MSNSESTPATPDFPHHGAVETGDPWLDRLGTLFLLACALDEGWNPPWVRRRPAAASPSCPAR